MAELDEPVSLSSYDARWPTLFADEAKRIRAGLQDNVAIEHIGSTAVPGLCAKPIIDIMIGAEPGQSWDRIRRRLATLGYEDMGEAGVPGRVYFRARIGAAFNIALVAVGGFHWRNNLAFRDFLRNNPSQAEEYINAKRAAVESGANSLLTYSEHKRDTLLRLTELALSWTGGPPTGK